jgi:hypothetical protein
VNYLVLHVRPYDFTGKDGKRHQGATVTYLDLNAPPAPGELGVGPIQLSVPLELVKSFPQAPALYSLGFSQRRGRDGKPELRISSAKLEGGMDLTTGVLAPN